MRTTVAAVAVAMGLALVAAPAAAQDATPAAELTSLEAALARDEQALATGECGVACPALRSMQRSVQRLCELDPGERCAKARARSDAAADRVRERCPECDPAKKKPGEDPKQVEATAGGQEVPVARPDAPDAVDGPAAAPPSEDAQRAGCAGCIIGGERPGSPALLAALGLLLALGARLRGRRRG